MTAAAPRRLHRRAGHVELAAGAHRADRRRAHGPPQRRGGRAAVRREGLRLGLPARLARRRRSTPSRRPSSRSTPPRSRRRCRRSTTSSSATSRTSTASGCRSSARTARTRPPRPTSRSSAQTYDALKAVDPTSPRLGRRARAARLRPAGRHPARRAPRPRSSRRWASPTARAAARCRSWTASRSIRIRTTRRQSPDTPHPRSTTIGLADYDKLVALLGDGVRRDGAAGLVAADPLRRVRGRVDDPDGQGEPLQRDRAGDDEAGRRDHAGGVLRRRRCSSRSASRT